MANHDLQTSPSVEHIFPEIDYQSQISPRQDEVGVIAVGQSGEALSRVHYNWSSLNGLGLAELNPISNGVWVLDEDSTYEVLRALDWSGSAGRTLAEQAVATPSRLSLRYIMMSGSKRATEALNRQRTSRMYTLLAERPFIIAEAVGAAMNDSAVLLRAEAS